MYVHTSQVYSLWGKKICLGEFCLSVDGHTRVELELDRHVYLAASSNVVRSCNLRVITDDL